MPREDCHVRIWKAISRARGSPFFKLERRVGTIGRCGVCVVRSNGEGLRKRDSLSGFQLSCKLGT